MKMCNLYLKIFAAACLCFFAAACVRDAAPGTGGAESYGSLDLGSITGSIVGTRAVDTGDFVVSVWRKSKAVPGEEVAAGSWPLSECKGTVRLLVSEYRLEVCSPGLEDAAWESPWYVGHADFAVTKDQVTNIGEVECRLGNIKVTVHYGKTLQDMLDRTSAGTTVTVGGGSLEYPWGERRGGYFSADRAASVAVRFEGTLGGEPTTYPDEIPGVMPGEWVRVFIDMEKEGDEPGRLVLVYDSEAGQIGDGDNWF